MYDFPRSHQMDTESTRNTLGRRHCYNNAEPANVEGHVFQYDISPKPGTSATVGIFNLNGLINKLITTKIASSRNEPKLVSFAVEK